MNSKDVHHHQTGPNSSRTLKNKLRSLFKVHSHADHDQGNANLGNKIGMQATSLSFAILMITALVQVIIVFMTNSVALLADTIHNFSDAFTSLPLFLAFWLNNRQSSKKYSYGYGRAEDLAGLVIILLIAISALILFWESFSRLLNPVPIKHLEILALAGLIGFLGNELVAKYRISVGKRINSESLIADGLHSRIDGLTSLAVLIGAFGVVIGFPILDPLIGIFIGAMILFILRDASIRIWYRLMDAVNPQILAQIENHAKTTEGVSGVHNVRARWLGRSLVADLHLEFEKDISIMVAHKITDQLKSELGKDLECNLDLLIHLDV